MSGVYFAVNNALKRKNILKCFK